MQHPDEVRSAEQLAFDLAQAFHFSVADLHAFRRGILPANSCQVLMRKAVQPLIKSAAVTLGPLILVAYLTSQSHHCSVSDGLAILFSRIKDVKGFAETEGWFMTVLYVLGGVGLLGLGVYFATRIPLDLMGDVIAKRVRCYDGRVTAREEEKRDGGKRDELPDYYFETKTCSFPVTRKAYTAIDSGGAYRVYFLPVSRTLVAIEPAMLAKEAEEKERKLKEAGPVESTI